MEVIRHGSGSAGALTAGGAGDPAAFRARQLRARDLLRGELEGEELEQHVEESVLTTTLDKAVKWAQGNSIFPLTFGLACCSIEMMSLVGSRMDISRFGGEAMRGTPRQSDLIILAGRVSMKMAPVVRRVYDQMLEPKYAIAMGACSSSMGVFNNYAVVPADKFLPVDVHVPGCPPRPEAVMYGILKLRRMIQDDPTMGWRDRYRAVGTEELGARPQDAEAQEREAAAAEAEAQAAARAQAEREERDAAIAAAREARGEEPAPAAEAGEDEARA
ncbi:NADH-quinone oxidoreductase subunit B [Patulibacter brassicae]|jgi:NADH-quinone oxidoreductase subunit B|uniref:NADH-quinone oxidoreductase subunit B n=1 Tax=Patulibacter brassicae TaxID=1705717 RepID=UPI003873CA67